MTVGFAYVSPAYAYYLLARLPVDVARVIIAGAPVDIAELSVYLATTVALSYLFKMTTLVPRWPVVSGILRDASRVHIGNGSAGAATAAEVMMAGRAWIGRGFRITSLGSWESANGLRHFRPPTFKPNETKWQANFEQRITPNGKWSGNAHVDILDPHASSQAANLAGASAATAAVAGWDD